MVLYLILALVFNLEAKDGFVLLPFLSQKQDIQVHAA